MAYSSDCALAVCSNVLLFHKRERRAKQWESLLYMLFSRRDLQAQTVVIRFESFHSTSSLAYSRTDSRAIARAVYLWFVPWTCVSRGDCISFTFKFTERGSSPALISFWFPVHELCSVSSERAVRSLGYFATCLHRTLPAMPRVCVSLRARIKRAPARAR